VSTLLNEAAEFFDNFFSKPVQWNKDTLIRERGAWVRVYGVPLHAWNIDFFKLCVLDCGRLLKVDDITSDRDRFDYARILLSTTSLEVIRTEASILIDGVLFDVQIIEEWGCTRVEDACLLDDEEVQYEECQECPEVHAEGVGNGDIDAIVNHLTADWEDVVGEQAHRQKSSPAVSPLRQGVETQLTPPLEGELSSDNPLLGFGAATSLPIERPSVKVGKNRSRELLTSEKKRGSTCFFMSSNQNSVDIFRTVEFGLGEKTKTS